MAHYPNHLKKYQMIQPAGSPIIQYGNTLHRSGFADKRNSQLTIKRLPASFAKISVSVTDETYRKNTI